MTNHDQHAAIRRDVLNVAVSVFLVLLLAGCDQAGSEFADIGAEFEPNSTSKNGDDMPSIIETMTPDEAVQAAIADLGFAAGVQVKARAEKATFSGESVPFLRAHLNGRETWRIEFSDVKLDRDSGNEKLRNPFLQKLIVFLCPESGTVLKVVSAWPPAEPRIPGYPSCTDQERQLRENSIEFTGLPKGPAKVSFCEAVGRTDTYSAQAKQVLAYRVLESHLEGEPREVWAIHLRGITSPLLPGPVDSELAVIPDSATNHLREVIDADSGDWLYSTSSPQPAGWLEDRF